MKKIFVKVLIFIVFVLFIFKSSTYETHNKHTLNVITRSETTNELEYIAIHSRWKTEKINKFVSDDFQLYYADPDCYTSYSSNNKVRNKLNKITFKDLDGNILENNEIFKEIFQSAEEIEHSIWELQIIKSKNDYYVLVKLNVNWHSPSDFYRYNKDEKKLELLHNFEDVDIVGLTLSSKE